MLERLFLLCMMVNGAFFSFAEGESGIFQCINQRNYWHCVQDEIDLDKKWYERTNSEGLTVLQYAEKKKLYQLVIYLSRKLPQHSRE